jgi:hypothetical protein
MYLFLLLLLFLSFILFKNFYFLFYFLFFIIKTTFERDVSFKIHIHIVAELKPQCISIILLVQLDHLIVDNNVSSS